MPSAKQPSPQSRHFRVAYQALLFDVQFHWLLIQGIGIIRMNIVPYGMWLRHQGFRCSAYWQSALKRPNQNGQRHQGLLPSLGAFTCLLQGLMSKHSSAVAEWQADTETVQADPHPRQYVDLRHGNS